MQLNHTLRIKFYILVYNRITNLEFNLYWYSGLYDVHGETFKTRVSLSLLLPIWGIFIFILSRREIIISVLAIAKITSYVKAGMWRPVIYIRNRIYCFHWYRFSIIDISQKVLPTKLVIDILTLSLDRCHCCWPVFSSHDIRIIPWIYYRQYVPDVCARCLLFRDFSYNIPLPLYSILKLLVNIIYGG